MCGLLVGKQGSGLPDPDPFSPWLASMSGTSTRAPRGRTSIARQSPSHVGNPRRLHSQYSLCVPGTSNDQDFISQRKTTTVRCTMQRSNVKSDRREPLVISSQFKRLFLPLLPVLALSVWAPRLAWIQPWSVRI